MRAVSIIVLGLSLATAAPALAKPAVNAAWLYGGTTLLAESTTTVTLVERTDAVLTFYVYSPNHPQAEPLGVQPTAYQPAATTEGTFTLLNPPTYYGDPLAVGATLPLVPADIQQLNAGEPLFVTLADGDQNLDPETAETVLVSIISSTGDTEILRLTETGPNTGSFSGYLMTSSAAGTSGDGVLHVEVNGTIVGWYTDIYDGNDTSNNTALVDPFGSVFDSRSGEPVSAVLVQLIDVATGELAAVYGEGGLACLIDQAAQPVITGGSVTDACGVTYAFSEGAFRFPMVKAGDYRLVLSDLPDGYLAPSQVNDAELQSRDWWGTTQTYLVTVGSRGEIFSVDPGPALRIDIPIDPHDGQMWLQKQVNRDLATVGDFLQYRLTLANVSSDATVRGASISDRLPLGLRYQKGSTRRDGVKTTDPAMTADGRELTFAVGDLLPDSEIEITYVIEVAAGARVGKAVNQAQAVDGLGGRSNLARAIVLIRELFFRDSIFLAGRVLSGSCDREDTEMAGLAGVRLYLEDGTFVVTDEDGKYHFEGIAPGTHVIQVDTFDLPAGYQLLPCDQSTQFAGRSFSQFVDLQGGTLWQVNFYAAPQPPPSGEMSLALQAALDGETARFTATASARQVPAENLQLTVMLPVGFGYLPGSAQRDGAAVADPQTTQAGVIFQLPTLPAGQTVVYTFNARLDGSAASGELPAKAVLGFDTAGARGQHTPAAETRFALSAGQSGSSEEIKLYPRFPSFIAELQETDRLMLEQLVSSLHNRKIVHLDLVGHTDSQEIAARSQHLFADNQALSEARAQQVASYLKERLALADDHLSIRGMGDSLPVADNATESGRALNRRVELYLVTQGPASPARLTLPVPASPTQTVPVVGLSVAEEARQRQQVQAETDKTGQQELVKGLLSPLDGMAVSRIEAVRIRLDSKLTLRVSVDGQDVPADRIGFRMTEPETGTTLYTYIGVDFGEPGTRRLLVEGLDPFGNVRFRQEALLIRIGDIASIRLLEVAENLADGRTPVRIRVELIDVFGRPVRAGSSLALGNSELRPLGEKPLGKDTNLGPVEQGRQVSVDAQGWISFNPVARSGLYPLHLTANGVRLETDIFVKPQMRDWILVGFAEGTVGYNTLNDNRVHAREAGIEEDTYTDGQVKFFAKGAIKGEWLLTLAYDSDKPHLDGDSLMQTIDPNRYYPLYGDDTRQGYEASSARDIFVKLEREQFYAMFGDMQTGMNQAELAKYVRSLNGFKSELRSKHFDYTVFAAETAQSFVKDEIRGDGTSGRYRLSTRPLVINSEQVVIETRDRFHNEIILNEESLGRHVDYEIDYDDGTLFFKRPVPSKDQDFNPIFIVVRYETAAAKDNNLNYGGRAALKLFDQTVEIGATLVHEENGTAQGDLYGADLRVQLTPSTTLRAEAATTEVDDKEDEDRDGEAWLAEIIHAGAQLAARGYLREEQGGFGLGQQNEGQSGLFTYGVDGSYQFNPRWSLAGEAYRQENLDSDAQRDVGQLEGRYRNSSYGLMAGLRQARDSFDDGEKEESLQMLLGGDVTLRKLTLRALHEQSLHSSNENSDFPTRSLVGAEWQLTSRLSVFAEQEFTWGDLADTQGTRAGFKSTPWTGGTLTSAVERELGENGERLFALFGLGQSWQISKAWSLDFALDRSHTFTNEPAGERVNDAVPAAYGGDDDFTAVSMGATYRAARWSWANRLETRQSDSEDKYGLNSGVVGDLREGLAASARLVAYVSDRAAGSRRDEQEIILGLAWRPAQSRWIFLERLDLERYNEEGDRFNNDGLRVINHLHASYRPDRRWQTSAYYGLKYVLENFDGDRYDSFTDMLALETRYNLTKRWDIGVNGAALHSWNSSQLDYSAGASIGCQVLTNSWISLGYNLHGFEDDDFSAANYTAEGVYVKLRVKFDQQSVKEAVEWLNK